MRISCVSLGRTTFCHNLFTHPKCLSLSLGSEHYWDVHIRMLKISSKILFSTLQLRARPGTAANQLYLFVIKRFNLVSNDTFTWFLFTLCCLELRCMIKKWLPVSWDLMSSLTHFWDAWPQCVVTISLIYRDQTWYSLLSFFNYSLM